MPIYLGSYEADKLQAITFPSAALPPHLKPLARWENIYSKRDAMGYPIKTINETYFQAVTADIQMNIGGLFTFWNYGLPHSLLEYKRIHRRIVAHVKEILQKCPAPAPVLI